MRREPRQESWLDSLARWSVGGKRTGPAPTSELAAPFEMAMPSFLQHLDVLADCGLVRSSKAGRVRTYELAPDALKAVEDWLAEQRALWEKRLDQLDDFLNELKEQSE